MRYSEFRGKDLTLGIWVFGDLLQYNEGGVAIGTHGQFIDDGYHFNECWNSRNTVDEETVGEFSGRYDNKGNKVFEGDILAYKVDGETKQYLEVRFDEGRAAFVAWKHDADGNSLNESALLEGYLAGDCTVCGNIYDNPELIKKEDTWEWL